MNWQGMNWCRPSTRLAIYLRDGLACAYCGKGVEDGIVLTLDHMTPRVHGGGNRPANLVTACSTCNSSKGERSLVGFCRRMDDLLGRAASASPTLKHVRNLARRKLPREQAREILGQRSSVKVAVEELLAR